MLIQKRSETMVGAAYAPESGAGEAHAEHHEHHGHHHDETIRLGVAIFGGILVLNSYLASLFFSKSIDPFAIALSAIVGALILAIPIWVSAVRDLVQGKVYMNELVALALLAAFSIGEYVTAGAVAFLMLITIILEQRTAIGAEASIESLIRLTPRQARRVRGEEEEAVDVLSLRVGDVCRVRPGENFPADGMILSGASSVNQASITGESLPVDKAPGAEVYAGTQNLTGLMEVRVTRVGRDTTLGKVRDLIVAAEKSRLPIMRMVDQYVGFYTPTILTIAALVWFFTGDLHRVIAVLVIACPCALVVATPSAVIAAIAAAARLGILIKDVTHIELAAKIGAVVFDKTGTLTEGVLEVAKLHPAPGVELAELLRVATSAESSSNHPAAQALRRLAAQAGVTWEAPSKYEEVPGKGVVAVFGHDTLRVGRATWLRDQGLDVDQVGETPGSGESGGMSIVYVARDRQVLGWIGMRDTIRAGAKEAVDRLKELGIRECCMVTGDNESAAQVVAGRLGITEVRAACLPQEKVEFVENLRRQGKLVAVVGDGVNDAPALAAGDIGIAMGAIGSDVAVHSASIALMNNDLRRIAFLVSLARRTQSLMNQNLLGGLALILVGLYLSTIGVVTPIIAAFLHSVGTLAIIFNSARLVRAGEELDGSVG